MTRAEEYRLRAEAAEARAVLARNREVKWILEEVARQWREMADQVERNGMWLGRLSWRLFHFDVLP